MVLWSGGIDSTAVLKKYLQDTDHEIVAVKIVYYTKDRVVNMRMDKELSAIDKLKPKLMSIREFAYHRIDVNMPNGARGADLPIFGSMCVYPAYSFGCREIVIGFVSDARAEQFGYVNDMIGDLNGIAEFQHLHNLHYWDWCPEFVLTQFYAPKSDYINSLGALVADCWFCRNPELDDGVNGCGECVTCKHVIKSVNQLNEKYVQ